MIEKLKKLGLSNKEAQIYLVLVKKGEATANELAKQTSSQRTVAYNVLQQLLEKGFVNYVRKGNVRMYKISDPKFLLSSIPEKELLANEIINDLKKVRKEVRVDKNVEVFEGLESMRGLFEEIKNSDNLRVLNATGKIFDYLIYSSEHIVKKIASKKDVKVIAVDSMKKTKLAKFDKIKFKYLPANAENIATTFIFNNKVIIQILKDKPFLIKIESKEIFEGYSKDFDVLWGKL